MKKNISGVILAGGAAKRFNGIIKPKILVGGKTIISRILESFDDIFDEIIIVTNTPDEFIGYSSCKITGDLFMNRGPIGGIHAAMKMTGSEAIFVVAGDMPYLSKKYIIRQIESFEQRKCQVLIPKINNFIEPLHGIYSIRILDLLEDYLSSSNDNAISSFIGLTDVRYLQIEDSEDFSRVFTNINSPSDIKSS
jgi:molybdopterin-guanine dinucleotide biosynthesis protein A